jgi:putative DNA primase/helicase
VRARRISEVVPPEVEEEREPEPDADPNPEPPEPWDDSLLLTTSTGAVRRCTANVITILAQHDAWAGVLAYDEFAGAVVTTRPPPWEGDDAPAHVAAGEWTEEDATRTAAWLSRNHELDVGVGTVMEAVSVVSRRQVVHPVRDHLRALRWDGVARLDRWLIDRCGAEDNDYSKAVASKFLIGAVARVERPGAKVDTVPIFEAKQGSGKSTACSILAGSDEWFLETPGDLGTKDTAQQLRKKWIVELSELDSLSRADVAKVKAFVSARVDSYRPSYGRTSRDFPRQCVFIGTTNASSYLKDESGARRFWPIALQRIDLAGLRADRAQLWAEAHVRFTRGEAWHLEDAALARVFAQEAEDRYVRDPWEEKIGDWLNEHDKPKRRTVGVTTNEVLTGALHLDAAKWTRADEMRASAVLRRLGWTPGAQQRREGVRVRLYRPAQIGEVVTPSASTSAQRGEDVTGVGTRVVTPIHAGNSGASSSPSLPSQPFLLHTQEEEQADRGVTEHSRGSPGSGRDVVTVVTPRPLRRRGDAVATLTNGAAAALPGRGTAS